MRKSDNFVRNYVKESVTKMAHPVSMKFEDVLPTVEPSAVFFGTRERGTL